MLQNKYRIVPVEDYTDRPFKGVKELEHGRILTKQTMGPVIPVRNYLFLNLGQRNLNPKDRTYLRLGLLKK